MFDWFMSLALKLRAVFWCVLISRSKRW